MNDSHDAPFVGIDIAKSKLDVCALPQRTRFTLDYSDDGVAKLLEQLAALRPKLIVVEATGGYERRLAADLIAAGFAVAVVNPAKVRDFARGTGTLAKNDRLDSFNLAYFAQAVQPAPREKTSDKQAELQALVVRRRQLVEMIVMESNRLKQLRGGRAKDSVFKMHHALLEERKLIDKQIL